MEKATKRLLLCNKLLHGLEQVTLRFLYSEHCPLKRNVSNPAVDTESCTGPQSQISRSSHQLEELWKFGTPLSWSDEEEGAEPGVAQAPGLQSSAPRRLPEVAPRHAAQQPDSPQASEPPLCLPCSARKYLYVFQVACSHCSYKAANARNR